MMNFKCKMCGGDLSFEPGASVAECPYCGTTQTLPKLDDDKRANLYDRANHFRRQNEYDKAATIYEQILAEDRSDAEAYWSLVLCRYGIEYVEDPASHKRVPTVNRVQYASILADEDYKSALQYADTQQRSVYEAEANAIAEIQKGILDISKQEQPFDVFICYKETDANGRRTPDSVLANDMYHQLTKEGFKVFFSRITLEDKIGTAYEPYIFAALNSAKVMVVLGTKPEYFNAVWVKNEWSRYLALIKSGADKTLVPAYRDMDPYDLPEEFAHLQAQDMGKLGFLQDLIRGIKKIICRDKNDIADTVGIVNGLSSTPNIDSLLKRAWLFLEDGAWQSANAYAEKVLDISPECASAYMVKLCVDIQSKSEAQISQSNISIKDNPNFKKAIRFANADQKKKYTGYCASIETRIENESKEKIYRQANEIDITGTSENDYRKSAELFFSITDYKDAIQRAHACEIKAEEIKVATNRAILAEQERKARLYQEQKRLEEELAIQAERKEKQKQLELKKRRRKKRILIISEISFTLVLITSVVFYVTIIRPKVTYDSALKSLRCGDYDKAQNLFSSLGDYRDAIYMSEEAQADKLFALGKYSEAYSIYSQLPTTYHIHTADYEAIYQQAIAAVIWEDYDTATATFRSIDGYKDAGESALDCQYQKGIKQLESKDYDDATATFLSIDSYKDAKAQATESQYQKGIDLLKLGDYDNSLQIFNSITDYKDAATKGLECKYQKAVVLLESGMYEEAEGLFGSIGNYNDSETQIEECRYQIANDMMVVGKYNEAYHIYSTIREYKDVENILKNNTELKDAISEWKMQFMIGNTVIIGKYNQDNDETNGLEDIEWIVLANDGETATLISKFGLEAMPYNTQYMNVTWKDSTIRKWLNESFFDTAFTPEEQKRLLALSLEDENDSSSDDSLRDKVFLLSIDEANSFFCKDTDRVCKPTETAIAKNAGTGTYGGCWWWLRSLGDHASYAAIVSTSGYIISSGRVVNYNHGTVRPVIVIDIS